MVELAERILNGIEGVEESLLVTSGPIVFAKDYSEEVSSYSQRYSI